MYRVTMVFLDLGCVDLDWGCSTVLLGQWVSTVKAHQPGEPPKPNSTQPRSATAMVTL